MLVAEKIARLEAFAEKNPGRAGRILSVLEALRTVPLETPLPDLWEALESDLFTDAQKWAIRWQFVRFFGEGVYIENLMEAATLADGAQLAHISRSYPDLVEGIRRCRFETDWWTKTEALLDR